MVSKIAGIALRAFQFLFGVVVLGLSISLIKNSPLVDGPNSKHAYAAFVGAITTVTAIMGVLSLWFPAVGGIISMVFDGFIILVNLVGGLIIAITIGNIKCSSHRNSRSTFVNFSKLVSNSLIGCSLTSSDACTAWDRKSDDDVIHMLVGRCQMNQADAAFQFLTVLVLLGSLVVTWMRMKNNK
ncbi:marvel domain-containing protein [Lophiotrema nucula]|uniref:Marvel domain-containing protein n=1 Tax=Lophiotrema nucula TaxID=690887 RepID=A0A6A5YSR7_9PLEO|nr:marvel domain-containing protein [Lophiotrema nucula]